MRLYDERNVRQYPAPFHGNDTANIDQPNTRVFEFVLCMNTLENAKVRVDIVHVESYTIFFDNKDIFTSIVPASYQDLGAGTGICGLILLKSEH